MNELENALRVIMNECCKHSSCHKCPLRNSMKHCGITETTPNKWKLIADEGDNYTPKVFCN